MPHPLPREPDREGGTRSLSSDAAEFYRRLYRPIVFRQPDRVVDPGSWLEHVPFAFWLVDAVRPATLVELGTHAGNSYAAFAEAIKVLELPTAAYAVDTWHGDAQAGLYDESVFVEWEAYHARHFSAFSRLIRSTFEEAAEHFADGSIDVLHIDGCHTLDAVSADFATWRPKVSQRGVVLFHDINVRERDFGAWRVWEELRGAFPSFEFLHGHGLGVLGVGATPPDALRWLFATHDRDSGGAVAIREFFSTLGAGVARRLVDTRTGASRSAQARHNAELEDGGAVAPRLTEELREVREQSEAFRQQVDDRQREIDHLRSQFDGLQARYQRRESGFDAELDEWRARLDAAEADRAGLDAALARQRSLLEELHQLRRPGTGAGAGAAEPAVTAPRIGPALGRGAGTLARRGLRRAVTMPVLLGTIPTRARGIRPPVRLMLSPGKLRAAAAVVGGGLFDEGFYIGRNPDVRHSGLTALAHFVLRGAAEGRDPHPLFDAAYYLSANPDVAAAAANPLLHYQRTGAAEGRNPHPLFDVAFYLRTNPDVAQRQIEPLRHFVLFGAAEGRSPNELFDCAYYLRHNADVTVSGINPLVHFVAEGWRERRRPSAGFDVAYYLAANPDVAASGDNPLAHYLHTGRHEGRRPVPYEALLEEKTRTPIHPAPTAVPLVVRSLNGPATEPPTIVCLSHVMPVPPRAGNEYRIYRLLRWLKTQGYRIVPVIAPLPGEQVGPDAVRRLAAELGNAVLCHRDGHLEYVLDTVPDVLHSLAGELARPIPEILDEPALTADHRSELLQMDRTFCHDALITAVTRLQQALGPHVLLAEYIWMARIFPLVRADVLKVVDTIDVFSTKRDKVLRFGIDDLHVDPREETRRLRGADLVIAIQDEERQELRQLVPHVPVVTAGVDFDIVSDPGTPIGRQVIYVASDNPMNRKGLSDFLRFAWPQVRRDVPEAELLLVGGICNTAPPHVPGVRCLGNVPDLAAVYRTARLTINPAVAGTGLKIKTFEALGHLRPIVSWPNGIEGMAPELSALCEVATDWYQFGRKVSRLLSGPEPRMFSAAERDTIVRLTSPAHVYEALTNALATSVAARQAAAAARSC